MKGCLTIGVSYERVTAKSKAFVQEKFVLEPDSVYQRRVVGRTGHMCLLGLKFFCKWADISDSEDCTFRRISSEIRHFVLRKRIRSSSMCITGTVTVMVFMSLLNLGITLARVLLYILGTVTASVK